LLSYHESSGGLQRALERVTGMVRDLVGAGVSISVGLPWWELLVEHLLEGTQTRSQDHQALRKSPLA
jgi:hypothetical protein